MLKSLLTQRKECFHIALICVGCDIPASRKLCGFLVMSVLCIYKMVPTNQGLRNCQSRPIIKEIPKSQQKCKGFVPGKTLILSPWMLTCFYVVYFCYTCYSFFLDFLTRVICHYIAMLQQFYLATVCTLLIPNLKMEKQFCHQ